MPQDNRSRARRTVALAGIALAIVLANVLFNTFALPHIELPDLPDLPDLPGWLGFLLGKGKLVVIAIVIVLALLGEEAVRHRDRDKDGT